jgi:hypothetical protein
MLDEMSDFDLRAFQNGPITFWCGFQTRDICPWYLEMARKIGTALQQVGAPIKKWSISFSFRTGTVCTSIHIPEWGQRSFLLPSCFNLEKQKEYEESTISEIVEHYHIFHTSPRTIR